MKKIFGILIIFIFFYSCNNISKKYDFKSYFNSQQYQSLNKEKRIKHLDSLAEVLFNDKHDSVNISNYLELSTQFYYNQEILKSRNLARKALEISSKEKDSLNLGLSNFYIADTFFNSNRDSAFYYYSVAFKIFQKKNNIDFSAKMQFYKAYILFYDGNYVDCEAKLTEALKIAENSENYLEIYNYFNLMGNCQEKLGNFEAALKYHQEAIKVLNKLETNDANFKYKISSIINICNLYEINGEYEKVISTLKNILVEEPVEQKSPEQFAIIINNIAYAKMKKGDFNGVEKEFLEALRISEEINNNNEILYRKVNLGEYYLTVGNIKKSEVYLKDALNLSKKIGNYNEYLKSLKFLAKVDLQNKDFYNDEYVRVKDSITTAQLTNREKYARIEYETSKLEEENEKLTQQNLIILLASLFVTALFILIVLLTRLNSQKKENKLLNDKQNAEKEMLALLEENRNNVERAKVNEQNRISKELHDGVLNDLYGVRLNLDYILSSRKIEI